MNIYSRLKQDHQVQRDLCEELAKTREGSQNRQDLWEELYIELEAHALAEEQAFYAVLMEKPDGTEHARHSVHEHQQMTKLMTELNAMDQTAEVWIKKFKELKHKVIHHVDEEEADIFPAAKKVIDSDKAVTMAEKFDKRKSEEIKAAKKAV